MAAESKRVLAVRDILTRSVRIGLGIPTATPRPGQALLADDMARAADPLGGHMAGLAPTGSGKSYASMSAAAVGAAQYGERWVIATEGLDLQQQYLRDSPHVAQAVKDAYGHDLKTAVLKGWSNYLCAQKTMNTVRQLGITNGAGGYDDTANRIDAAHLKDSVFADGRVHESKTLRPLLSWAVKQHQNPDVIGDKASYRGQMTDREWQAVSVSTQECVGENACPLAAICKPRISREKAAEADIVITNHAMLAVQAANNTPVVIGNSKLGPFHGIIVDEAQSLPASVRSQGTVTISAPRLHGIVNRVREAVGGPGNPSVDQWALDGREVIRYVESEIHAGVASVQDGRIPKDTDPLANTGDVLTQWLKQGSQYIQSSTDQTDMASVIAGKRGSAAIDQMVQAVKDVRDHYVGVSRAWTESGDVSAIETAPVTVSGMLTRNIWNDSSGNGDEPPQDDTVKPPAGDDHQEAEVEPRPLTAICISGTLPKGFPATPASRPTSPRTRHRSTRSTPTASSSSPAWTTRGSSSRCPSPRTGSSASMSASTPNGSSTAPLTRSSGTADPGSCSPRPPRTGSCTPSTTGRSPAAGSTSIPSGTVTATSSRSGATTNPASSSARKR